MDALPRGTSSTMRGNCDGKINTPIPANIRELTDGEIARNHFPNLKRPASNGAPPSRATTIPPIISERSPASSGTPDAIAIPIHIGSAPVEYPVPANGSSSPVSTLQHEGCLFSHHPDRSFLNPCLHLHGQYRNVYIFPKALSWIILKLSRPSSGSTQFD